MQTAKWVGVAGALILVLSCFFPWATIESKNITISGVAAEGTSFGRPGYFHFLIAMFYFIFLFINKNWSRYFSLFLGAINLGWAIRNFILIGACQGGECPVKHTALKLLIPASVIMLLAILFISNKRGIANSETSI